MSSLTTTTTTTTNNTQSIQFYRSLIEAVCYLLQNYTAEYISVFVKYFFR